MNPSCNEMIIYLSCSQKDLVQRTLKFQCIKNQGKQLHLILPTDPICQVLKAASSAFGFDLASVEFHCKASVGFRDTSETVSPKAHVTPSVCLRNLWEKQISEGEKFLQQTSAPWSSGALWCCSLGKGLCALETGHEGGSASWNCLLSSVTGLCLLKRGCNCSGTVQSRATFNLKTGFLQIPTR